LKRLKKNGVPVIVVSNDQAVIDIADRVVRLDAGRVKAVEDRKEA
jgi:ABC-type sulfate/molybdate transport systems ATPase subunit